MKIIKRGAPPKEKKYEGTCHTCKSVLEAEASEVNFVDDQRDGNYISGECPVCGGFVYFSEKK